MIIYENILSPNAANIMRYCRLKSQLVLYSDPTIITTINKTVKQIRYCLIKMATVSRVQKFCHGYLKLPVLFKPSTHLFQWSKIRLGLLLRWSVEWKFCQTYGTIRPWIFVKLSKTVRANDSQTVEVQYTALQDLQSGKSSCSLLVRGKHSVTPAIKGTDLKL